LIVELVLATPRCSCPLGRPSRRKVWPKPRRLACSPCHCSLPQIARWSVVTPLSCRAALPETGFRHPIHEGRS
jgi:hypothetical protein